MDFWTMIPWIKSSSLLRAMASNSPSDDDLEVPRSISMIENYLRCVHVEELRRTKRDWDWVGMKVEWVTTESREVNAVERHFWVIYWILHGCVLHCHVTMSTN